MAYRAANPEAPVQPPLHSATWIALGLGVTSMILALASVWGVIAFGLFEPPPSLALVPIGAASVDAVATGLAVRRARTLSRAPWVHGCTLVLAVVALGITMLAGYAYVDASNRPPPTWPSPHGQQFLPLWSC
jgi:hypothetical protein